MSRVNLILGVILIIGFLFRETYSQCSGTKQVIHPSNFKFQSPNYPNELDKAANCTWEFSSGGKEYILVLTVVNLRLYFVVNRKKECSGSYILKMNNESVDCKKYVEPPNAGIYCSAYYSSDTCNTKQLDCKKNKHTSFPVQVTYEADGKTVAGNTGTLVGFEIEYKYIECLPETTTAVPTAAISTTEKVYATEMRTTSMPASTIAATTTPAFVSNKSNSDKTAEPITVGVAARTEEIETTKDGGTDTATSQQKIIIIAASGGGGLFLIIIIAMAVVWLSKRKRNSPATEEHEFSKSTEVDQLQMDDMGADDQNKMNKNITPDNQETESNIHTTVVYDAPCQSEDINNPVYSTVNKNLRSHSENPSKVKVQSDSATNTFNESKSSKSTENISPTNQKKKSNIHTTVVYDTPCQSEEKNNPIYSTANEHLCNQSENASKVKTQSGSTTNTINQSKPRKSTENTSRTNQPTESNMHTTVMYDAPCQSEEIVNPLYSTANEHLGSQSAHTSRIKNQSNPTRHKTNQSDTCPTRINVGQSYVSYSVIPDIPSTVDDVLYDTTEHDNANLIDESLYDMSKH